MISNFPLDPSWITEYKLETHKTDLLSATRETQIKFRVRLAWAKSTEVPTDPIGQTEERGDMKEL